MCHIPNLEVPVISAPDPKDGDEASLEPRPENQAPTPGPSQGGVEPGENALGEETPNKVNEILAPTDDLSPHDPVAAQPTLDHIVKDVLAEIPQADGEEPGEANELVEDAAGNKAPHTSSGRVRKGVLNRRQLREATATKTHFLQAMGTFNSTIAALNASDVASTLARNKERHQEGRATAMSNLPPSSAEESADTGPGPDSSQDLRTSIL
ncbi:hypothetical protein EYF80_028591 [Liparis tanakae]|uniref:Uncharacterized protein n=1 Tax=Liparis tanakae TaxID=230148 RepID=A0A4Z2H640_9TELE|nr:hypothetical protein EYF80_028591 [Liparis tanakae]